MSTSVNSKVSGIATGDVLSDGSVPYTGTLYGANGISTFVSIYPGSNSPVGLAGSTNNGLLFLGDDGGGMRTHVKIAKYSNVILANDYGLSWASTNDAYAGSIDLTIIRDAANILAQRNSTNAQTFRVYNTRTDASNYERGFMRWNSSVFEVGNEAAGTGTANRRTKYYGYGTGYLEFWASAASLAAPGAVDVLTLGPWDGNTAIGISLNGLSFGRYAATNIQIGRPILGQDVSTGTTTFSGAGAVASATTNIVGGIAALRGGVGASSSAGNAHGGNVEIGGGTGYGTGHNGRIKLINMPTSASGLAAGELWSNGGVITMV